MNKTGYVYMIKCVYLTHTDIKIGYTDNIERRLIEYKTHNTQIQLLSYITTYSTKTARVLEKELHKEQRDNGERLIDMTEWVKYNHLIGFIRAKQGFKRFKCLRHYAIKDICKVAQ
jgi:predicted GIY-YIG superfamily endonuclease